MSNVYKEMDAAREYVEREAPKLTDAEKKVYDIIGDEKYLFTYEPEFFAKSLDELNKHFGGSGDMVITEPLRKVMYNLMKYRDMTLDMVKAYVGVEDEGKTNKDAADDPESAFVPEEIREMYDGLSDEQKKEYLEYARDADGVVFDKDMILNNKPNGMDDDVAAVLNAYLNLRIK